MQISISLLVEGSTDATFLEDIISRVFEAEACDCRTQVDILPINTLNKITGSFSDQVLAAAKQSIDDFGANIFCLHTDADGYSAADVLKHKIAPAKAALLAESSATHCQNLVLVIPIQETEAWMLADKALFKREINTTLTDQELNIHRPPEAIANPKELIEAAIRKATAHLTKRRRQDLTIGDLYGSMGALIGIAELDALPSFQAFKLEVRAALMALGLR